MSDLELDEEESNDYPTYPERESDEDTEDASETDMVRFDESLEIKEEIYIDKRTSLKDQLIQLERNIHPEYTKELKKLEKIYDDRLLYNEAFLNFETERIEKEYIYEQKAAVNEFEERKIELKENLISELEEKRRMIENERTSFELTSDSIEPKAPTTRKLRRRPNEPIPVPEKRKRGSPAQLNQLLEDHEIMEDLKTLTKAAKYAIHSSLDMDLSPNIVESRIEDGKLYYDRKWFHRGQPVVLKSKDNVEFSGILSSIGVNEVWLKKTVDNSKFRVFLSNLQRGKFEIHRCRAT